MSPAAPVVARPFLKWAGGKRQLLTQIDRRLPQALKNGALRRYVEPFLGSGAVFLHVAQAYPVSEIVLADLNPELILAYRTVQDTVEPLIETLRQIEAVYLPLSPDERREYYYGMRRCYNAERAGMDFARFQEAWIGRTAQMIFLNRTCYNGLFRVNSKGHFNVPFGRYARPAICDAANLRAVAAVLQRATIHDTGYDSCAGVVDARTFVYFDPPYRPLTATARFTAYSRHAFGDAEQLRLAAFYRELDARGALLMLSNSDPQNVDPEDTFFEEAYSGFRLERVLASRRINSQAGGRGPIHELLILNY